MTETLNIEAKMPRTSYIRAKVKPNRAHATQKKMWKREKRERAREREREGEKLNTPPRKILCLKTQL